MNRRGWTLVGVGIALVVLIGGWFLLSRPKAAAPAAPAAHVLSKGDKDTLAKITLSDRAEGMLTLVKKAGHGTWSRRWPTRWSPVRSTTSWPRSPT